MRLSAHHKSPDYRGRHFDVYLDDVQMRDVFEADDDVGYVKHYVRDDQGHLRLNEAKTEIVHVTKFGRVRIVDQRAS